MSDEPQDRLTLEEHLELSQEVKSCVARLRQLSALVAQVYGPESQPGLSFLKSMEALERLNRDLREQAKVDLANRIGDDLYT